MLTLLSALGSPLSFRVRSRLTLEFELVYGHAFKPPPRARLAAETTVALEDLRRMVRRAPLAPRR